MSEFIEDIEKYLKGDMKPEEKQAFEERLEIDDDFRMNFDAYKVSQYILEDESDKRLKTMLMGMERKGASSGIPLNRNLAIAAAVALVLVSFGIYLFTQKPFESRSLSEVYNEYYKPMDTGLVLERSEGDNEWNKAISHYKTGNYEDAIEIFKVLSLKPDFEKKNALSLFFGLSLLESGDSFGAIKKLEEVSSESGLFHDANWYIGLIYIKERKIDLAITEFEKIARVEKHQYRQQAEIILSDLKRVK
jgi:tetratricopeptide (TPR) repeat protein